MPPGNELLENQCWQAVPGDEQSRIFPYLRKVDTNSSNSYIISTPGQIILIDPGGYMEQMDLLAAEIEKIRQELPRPVFVYLTHAHIDHFAVMQTHPFFRGPGPIIVAAHKDGALSIESGDTTVTQADMFQVPLKPMHVPIKFFSSNLEQESEFFEICPLEAPCVRFQESDIVVDEHLVIKRQVVMSGPQDRIEVYHMPGHSADSLCFRIGGLLFIGDLLFAANPGIAGLRGWSQRDLLTSLHKVHWILDNEDIRICCPGHGRVISSGSAESVFTNMAKEAFYLTEIQEINPEWAKATAEYAEDLMDRVAETFTIMAGRCYRAAHILEELEEAGEAENLSGLVNAATIDSILADFHRFNEDYRAGKQCDVHLALKAGQITAKLENVYLSDQLDLVIDPYLVRRATRLLSDYMVTFRGFRPRIEREEIEINKEVGHCITTLTSPACSDEDLISLADDEDQYRKALVRRLVHVPVFDGNPISFDPSEYPFTAIADRERLIDLISGTLEEIAGSGGREIQVSITRESGQGSVTIRAEFEDDAIMTGKKIRFMGKECELSGGFLSCSNEDAVCTIVIEVPVTE